MKNRTVTTGGGVEDLLAPQPGPSQPTSGRHKTGPQTKRKALDEEEPEAGASKRTKSLQATGLLGKHKIVKGEKKAGGLIISPILPPSSAAPVSSNSAAPLPSKQPAAGHKIEGKGKGREVVAPTRQDLEADEDVRLMEEERVRLRVRDAETHAKSVEFQKPLLLKPSVPSRRPSEFASPMDTAKRMDTVQPLPVRDTPTIDRNRAMRGEPIKRRSSMTMRGKRASSSFENTGVIPQPHPSVPTSSFHKHVDLELPEAHRARHLLVWCAARTAAPQGRSQVPPPQSNGPPLPPLTAEGVNILHEVQKEVQKMLTEQRIDTSLSSHMDEDGNNVKVKEHEQNAKNRKREDDFMRHIERCKQEDAEWFATIQTYNTRQATTLDAIARQRAHIDRFADWTPIDPSDASHDRQLQGAQLARKCKETASRKRSKSPLALRMEEAENKIDRLHSALHVSDQFMRRTTRHLNKRFEGLAAALAARSQPPVKPGEVSTLASLVSADPNPRSATGLGAPPDTLSILRALARTDVGRPQREMGDAAWRAAREVQRVNAASGRGSVGGPGPSERKLTAVVPPTPRKAGTPRRPGTPRQRSEGPDDRGG